MEIEGFFLLDWVTRWGCENDLALVWGLILGNLFLNCDWDLGLMYPVVKKQGSVLSFGLGFRTLQGNENASFLGEPMLNLMAEGSINDETCILLRRKICFNLELGFCKPHENLFALLLS